MRLNNARAVVTGACGGIGHALVTQLANSGARIILSGRDQTVLDANSADLNDACLATCCGDLTEDACRRQLADTARKYDANLLINVMGVNHLGLVHQQPSDLIENLIHTNLCAPILVTRQLLPVLLENTPALVVNIGSAFGSIGYPGYAVYSATKFGLRGFSEALGRELADTGVGVLYIAPRATRTTMNDPKASALNTSLGNTEDPPEWVASQIVAAIAKERKRTYLGWPEKLFIRINSVFPAMVDRSLARSLPVIKKHI